MEAIRKFTSFISGNYGSVLLALVFVSGAYLFLWLVITGFINNPTEFLK